MSNKRKTVRFAEETQSVESGADTSQVQSAKRRRRELVSSGEESSMQALSIGDAAKQGYESKHTLESDEEEEEKYERLDMDTIDGQEDVNRADLSGSDEDFDGETKLTPFNMKEEAEDGHFDAAGNFVFNKAKEEIRDEWMDGIDWGKVKRAAGQKWATAADDPASPSTSAAQAPEPLNRTVTYRALLGHMRPGESVTKTLRRLGGKETAAEARKRRWQAKKAKAAAEDAAEASALDVFTALVDALVSDGDMEAYGFTYEKIAHDVAAAEAAKTPGLAEDADDDDALEALGAGLDGDAPAGKPDKTEGESKKPRAEEAEEDEVRWEFKWTEGGEVQGPCGSAQMAEWKERGYFKEGILCRKAGDPQAPFYSSARVDFDLYT